MGQFVGSGKGVRNDISLFIGNERMLASFYILPKATKVNRNF